MDESTRVSPCCSSCTGSDAQAACSPLAFASWAAEQGEPEREGDADEPDRERNSLQRAEPPVCGVQQRVVAAGRREGIVSTRRLGWGGGGQTGGACGVCCPLLLRSKVRCCSSCSARSTSSSQSSRRSAAHGARPSDVRHTSPTTAGADTRRSCRPLSLGSPGTPVRSRTLCRPAGLLIGLDSTLAAVPIRLFKEPAFLPLPHAPSCRLCGSDESVCSKYVCSVPRVWCES